jgi:predicted HicB family RNase H-like nuclease
MAKNKRKIDPIPDEFTSFEELADFWETHDLTDYEDQLQEVSYKVARKPSRQFVVTLSDELTKAMRRAARHEGVSMQTLVNLWVQERLQQYRAVA